MLTLKETLSTFPSNQYRGKKQTLAQIGHNDFAMLALLLCMHVSLFSILGLSFPNFPNGCWIIPKKVAICNNTLFLKYKNVSLNPQSKFGVLMQRKGY